jgi:hypothetical protein
VNADRIGPSPTHGKEEKTADNRGRSELWMSRLRRQDSEYKQRDRERAHTPLAKPCRPHKVDRIFGIFNHRHILLDRGRADRQIFIDVLAPD